jgi:hypothetical protein
LCRVGECGRMGDEAAEPVLAVQGRFPAGRGRRMGG